MDTPYQDLPADIRKIFLYGTDGKKVKVHYRGQRGVGVYDIAFEGLIRNEERRYREFSSERVKQEYESYMRITPCNACGGRRLKPESLAVTIADKNIYELTSMSVRHLYDFLQDLPLTKQQQLIGAQVLKEIRSRVSFFKEVGLDYLTLT